MTGGTELAGGATVWWSGGGVIADLILDLSDISSGVSSLSSLPLSMPM